MIDPRIQANALVSLSISFFLLHSPLLKPFPTLGSASDIFPLYPWQVFYRLIPGTSSFIPE